MSKFIKVVVLLVSSFLALKAGADTNCEIGLRSGIESLIQGCNDYNYTSDEEQVFLSCSHSISSWSHPTGFCRGVAINTVSSGTIGGVVWPPVYGGGNWCGCGGGSSAAEKPNNSVERPVCQKGSIIQIENQTVSEKVPIVGTKFSMFYHSGYMRGRTGDFKFVINLAEATPRDYIQSFDVVLSRGVTQIDSASFLNNTGNQSYSFIWDGLDVNSNPAIGTEKFKVVVTENSPAGPLVLPQEVVLGNFDAKQVGLGGWLPNIFNFYDKNSQTLFRGDGSSRKVEAKSWSTNGHYVAEIDGSVVYYFDSTGRQVSTKSGLTGSTIHTFSYDLQGRLTSIIEPFQTTTFTYSGGLFSSIVAAKGQTTAITLDSNGYISSITNPNNESFNMVYFGVGGLLSTFTKPGGQVSSFTFDADGNLQRDAHSGGYFFDLIMSNKGRSHQKVTPLGRTTSYQSANNAFTFDRQVLTPDGLTETYSKDTLNNYVNEVAQGITVSTSNIPDARFGKMTDFPSVLNFQAGPVTYSVNSSQNITLTDPNDPYSISTYSTTSQKNNLVITSSYSPSAKAFSLSTGLGKSGTLKVDNYERITEYKRGNLHPVELVYTNENLTKIKQNTRETNLTYSSVTGYLTSITDPVFQTTSFTFDSAGRIVTKVLPDLRIIGYSYDANGNIAGVIPPGRAIHSFGLNASELPGNYAPPTLSGVSTVNTLYSYNDDNQLTQILRPTGDAIQYTYNLTTGVLESFVTPADTYSLYMNATNGLPSTISSTTGPITNITYAGNVPTQYTVYANGWSAMISDFTANLNADGTVGSDVVATSTATSTVNYLYNDDEDLKKAGDLNITYNTPNGQLTGTSLGSGTTGMTDVYTYNSYGEVETYTAKRGTTTIYSLTLGRDGMGRINGKTEFMNAATNVYGYTFDVSGRLTQTDKNSVTVATYGYDDNSNRNSGTIGAQATTASYDAQDRMTAYNTLTFTYNANGDLLSKTNTTTSTTTNYVYDVFGNLTQVTLPNGTVITYEIDGLNRRIGKRVNGVLQKRWVYMDQTRIAAELNASGGISKRFIYGSKKHVPDYMLVGSTKYRIISDHLGSPRLVVKQSDGSITQRMNHDEYGRVTEDTNPGSIPFGFAGGLYDNQTSLVRFGARDYDAETGRWTRKDPILFGGLDANLYGYVWNDPINWVDPQGTLPPLLAVVGAGAAVGGVASFTGTLLGGGSVGDAFRSIPGGALGGVAATITTLGAIAGGAPTGAAVATGVFLDLLVSFAMAPDGIPTGSGQDFANGINNIIKPPKSVCP